MIKAVSIIVTFLFTILETMLLLSIFVQKIGKKEDSHDMPCVDIQVAPDVVDIMKANKCKILLPTQWV